MLDTNVQPAVTAIKNSTHHPICAGVTGRRNAPLVVSEFFVAVVALFVGDGRQVEIGEDLAIFVESECTCRSSARRDQLPVPSFLGLSIMTPSSEME